jgi:D-3-phosphoglycerate dehydrogenase
MKPKILRTDAELFILEREMATLGAVAEVVTTNSTDAGELARLAADATIILTCYIDIPAQVIDGARNLKGIVKYGVGTDNIDLEAATRNGVAVANCPDYGSDTVADHAFALLIDLARNLRRIDDVMRAEAWVWPLPQYLGLDLSGKTLGLLGLGRIGRAMARRGGGFGMERIACDPYIGEDVARADGVTLVSFDELLARSDFLSVHCVHTPETRGLLGEAAFRAMKESAFLINVSRGAIVDEDALVRTLKEGGLAGAGLDVFPHEPLTSDYPLLGMDNVILTPHLAWWTKEAFDRVEQDTLVNVMEILEGKRPRRLKNTDLYAPA